MSLPVAGPLSARTGALALTALCALAAWFALANRYLPTHDAIGWYGLYHYYAEVVMQGRVPWWNPYGRGGEAFFPHWQLIGLLQPTYLVAALLQKLTDMPSVLAYTLHYFFQIYLFVLGLFLVLNFLTRHAGWSLLAALMALLGLLPSVLRQNGAILGFVFIPLLHYFVLRFFYERDETRRGPWLFLAASTAALALNSLIGVPLILFLLCLAAGFMASGRDELRGAWAYVRTRAGAKWLTLSLGTCALLVLPVAALYLEFRAGDELFPLIRLLQHGNEQFPRCFASDLVSDLFDNRFTGYKMVSLTPWNLAGLFLEPFARVKSEITLFIGTLGLGAAAMALRRPVSPSLVSAVLMIVLPALIAVNFRGVIHDAPFVLQSVMATLLPFLKLTDVVQNYGVLILYGLALLAGLGLRHLRGSTLALSVVVIAPLFFKLLHRNGVFKLESVASWLVLAACIAMLVLLARNARLARPTRVVLVWIAFALLAVEMYAYERHYLARAGALSRDYHDLLQRLGLLAVGDKPADFGLQREPFTFRDSDRFKQRADNLAEPVTMWGRDVMAHAKSAFPSLFRRYIGEPGEWTRYPMWDHLYATRYYYDYLVNIDPARQLAVSGVSCPLLRVVSRERVMEAASQREAAATLNAAEDGVVVLTAAPLRRDAVASVAADACFAKRDALVAFSDADRKSYRAALAAPCAIRDLGAGPRVERYDENSLVITATAPASGGYLYYADGYSRHWKAYVDGEEVPVRLANLAFKAVALPSGRHRVEFRYEPALFRAALWLYAGGLALQAAVIAGWLLRRRSSLAPDADRRAR